MGQKIAFKLGLIVLAVGLLFQKLTYGEGLWCLLLNVLSHSSAVIIQRRFPNFVMKSNAAPTFYI